MLSTMTCQKCNTKYDPIMASCGTGQTWSLYCCPNCKQLYAQAHNRPAGFIPKEVLADRSIVILEKGIYE